ncbi:hypothetical protein AB0P17_15330 [Streptomyces sp. NPDC088124]|uniref:hypothetical protein n=1 Tax=Streptomyces sp. NPDC088124 TaxID=3154654 RepID=UPI0034272330
MTELRHATQPARTPKPGPAPASSGQIAAARDALGRSIALLDKIREKGGQWPPRRAQRLYRSLGYRGIPLRMSVLGDLDRLHRLGYLNADTHNPDHPVYTLRTTSQTPALREKTTPTAAAAGTAVTPGSAAAVEADTLTAVARALREQPTGRQLLDGLDELGEAVVLEDTAAVVDWVSALSHLLDNHRAVPLGPAAEADVSKAGHETVIADRIRAHCGTNRLSADQAAIEIVAWHIRPLLDHIAALEDKLAAPVTRYRAEHESFPVAEYTNKAAVVAHLEDLLVQEEGEAVRPRIVWSDPDQDEEVPIWDVHLRDPATGDLIPTGYMVTAIPLPHDYDAEAEG